MIQCFMTHSTIRFRIDDPDMYVNLICQVLYCLLIEPDKTDPTHQHVSSHYSINMTSSHKLCQPSLLCGLWVSTFTSSTLATHSPTENADQYCPHPLITLITSQANQSQLTNRPMCNKGEHKCNSAIGLLFCEGLSFRDTRLFWSSG